MLETEPKLFVFETRTMRSVDDIIFFDSSSARTVFTERLATPHV